MAVQTKVPYRVTEKTLKKWLEQNVGEDKAGKPRFTYEVTAPRQITPDEIEDMKIQDKKLQDQKLKSGSGYTFDVDEDEEK